MAPRLRAVHSGCSFLDEETEAQRGSSGGAGGIRMQRGLSAS